MTNLKNAVDVFGLAKNLGIDIRRLFDVINIEHFADAMRARGLDTSSLE